MTEEKTSHKVTQPTQEVVESGQQTQFFVPPQVIAQLRQGPIPTPQEMAGYKNVSPDLPDRIMKMAEKEQDSQYSLRIALAKSKDKIEENSYKRDRLTFILKISALILATILCIIFIGCAVYFFIKGNSFAGSLFTAPAFIAILKYMLGINLSDFREKHKDSKK